MLYFDKKGEMHSMLYCCNEVQKDALFAVT